MKSSSSFFIYKFNWLFNNNNTSIEFFFSSSSLSSRCFSIWSYTNVHSSIAEKKKLTLSRLRWVNISYANKRRLYISLFDVSQPIYFTFFLSLRKNHRNFLKERRSSFLCVFYWSYRLPDVIIVEVYIVHLIEGRSYESLLNNEISCNWE